MPPPKRGGKGPLPQLRQLFFGPSVIGGGGPSPPISEGPSLSFGVNHNERECLVVGNAQFEPIPAEHEGDWACPKCWLEAIKKYKTFKKGNGKRKRM